MAQVWNAAGYEQQGRFVADLAGDILALLDPQPVERILDLGCGDGVLTGRLREMGAIVTGIDSSPELVEAARAQGLDVSLGNGEQLQFQGEFNAVFSNAALHWMRDQDAVLAGVRAALRSGGRLVVEMGGHGNIAAIRAALQAACAPFGMDAEKAGHNFFFTPEEYTGLLERHGFRVDTMQLIPRPTPLPAGIEGWLGTFRRGVLDRLSPEQRNRVVAEVSRLLTPILRDRSGRWHADYVRLRFRAFAR